ncbi:MAG TPA: SMP-30/gluconolactonase/LRE family protein [Phnomibacter sp.]|nr:SMP-30/gluconolactonase/LRE family protein [Phnomibacter sp.]
MKIFLPLVLCGGLFACQPAITTHNNANTASAPGNLICYDTALYNIIDSNAPVRIIADSLTWSEGPLWLEKQQKLLFSDVPENKIFEWTESNGKQLYLSPSGFTGSNAGAFRETGSNGLLLDAEGHLVLCQHGDRRIATMNAPIDAPASSFTTIANQYNGKKFSSPNDCVLSSSGEYYFTDPPYGLKKMDEDPLKETAWNGVYKIKKDGTVLLLTDSITKPNGIALFPGEKRLLIANSDPEKPNWYVWDIEGDSLKNGKIFYSAADHPADWKGLPDGCKIDSKGNTIASGPGGVYFFNSTGKILGILRLANACSNIALSGNERTLFVTNHTQVLRIQMKP